MSFKIANTEIPEKKSIVYALTYVFGIGFSRSSYILKEAKINKEKKTKDLNFEERKKINTLVHLFKIGNALKKENKEIIMNEKEIGTYRSQRWGKLPVRGQRTRSNSNTCKGRKRGLKIVTNKGKEKVPFQTKK